MNQFSKVVVFIKILFSKWFFDKLKVAFLKESPHILDYVYQLLKPVLNHQHKSYQKNTNNNLDVHGGC